MDLRKILKEAKRTYEQTYETVGTKIDETWDNCVEKYKLTHWITKFDKKCKDKTIGTIFKSLCSNTWEMMKKMPKKQLVARLASVSLIYTLMLPVTTVNASQLIIRDGADKISEKQETALIEQISELTEDCEIDVLIVTNKKESIYNNANEFAKEELKLAYPDSECTLGVVFDFYTSSYAIVPQGAALNYITEEEIEDVFNFCDSEFKKEDFSVNACCEKILSTFFISINDTYAEDKNLAEEIQEIQDVSESVRTTGENVNEYAAVRRGSVTVKDLADLLTIKEESELSKYIDSLFIKEDYNIVVITTNDTNEKNTLDYCDELLDSMFAETDENITFIIDMDNREIHINTMGTAIQRIDESEINAILDKGYEYVTEKQYKECFVAMADECLLSLENSPAGKQDLEVGLTVVPTFATKVKQYVLPSALISLVSTIIVFMTLLLSHNKSNRTLAVDKYESKSDYNVVDEHCGFVRRYETVTHDFYKPASSDNGGLHTSSTGRSHGGGSRKF